MAENKRYSSSTGTIAGKASVVLLLWAAWAPLASAAGLSGKIVFRSAALGRLAMVDLASGSRTPLAVDGYEPALSPDGRLLAYRDRRERLHVRVLESGADTALADTGAQRSPTFIGNTRIAYVREGTSATEICISPVGGGAEQVWKGRLPLELTPWMRIVWIPGTSEQSPEFVLQSPHALHMIGAPVPRELLSEKSPVTYRYPAVSPDGRRVAFVKDDGLAEIFIADFGSGKVIQLTERGDSSWPAWSPDGQRIAFLTAGAVTRGLELRQGAAAANPGRAIGASVERIVVMDVRGSEPVAITTGGEPLDTVGDQMAWR